MNTIDTHIKEQQLLNLVGSYRRGYVGKGPNNIRVSFKDNWVIAYTINILSKVESFYLNDERNESMLHYTHVEKIKRIYKEIDMNEMESLVSVKFVKLSTDIDLNGDEVISVFALDKPIE